MCAILGFSALAVVRVRNCKNEFWRIDRSAVADDLYAKIYTCGVRTKSHDQGYFIHYIPSACRLEGPRLNVVCCCKNYVPCREIYVPYRKNYVPYRNA